MKFNNLILSICLLSTLNFTFLKSMEADITSTKQQVKLKKPQSKTNSNLPDTVIRIEQHDKLQSLTVSPKSAIKLICREYAYDGVISLLGVAIIFLNLFEARKSLYNSCIIKN